MSVTPVPRDLAAKGGVAKLALYLEGTTRTQNNPVDGMAPHRRHSVGTMQSTIIKLY